MDNLKKREGISLITLIITIVVIIILTAAVILNLSGEGGVINRANQAKYENNKINAREQIEMAVGKSYDILGDMNEDSLIRNLNKISGIEILTNKFPIRVKLYGVYAEISKSLKISILDNLDEFEGKYTVANVEELSTFRNEVNSGTFTGENDDNTVYLIADIDMSSVANWTPIGTAEKPFSGTFIGGNHKIENLKINSTSANTGLFGYNTGTIDGIKLESGKVSSTQAMTGGICGYNTGTIKNCINNASVSGTSTQTGGIVGMQIPGSLIENCGNKGYIDGWMAVGGICGVSIGDIKYCYNSGEIRGTQGETGGITGVNQGAPSSVVLSCYNSGNIYANESGSSNDAHYNRAGGIVGFNCNGSVVNNCYNIGGISVKTSGLISGGVAGSNQATVQNSYFLESSCTNGIGSYNTSGTTPKTQDEIKNLSLLNSGDINVWKVDENNLNYGFPVLNWQTEKTYNYDATSFMPNMVGVSIYYDSKNYSSGTTWKNLIGINDITISGNVTKEGDGSIKLNRTADSYAYFYSGRSYNKTIYLIAKDNQTTADMELPLLTSTLIYPYDDKQALDISSYNGKIIGTTLNSDVISGYNSLDYNVIAISSDISIRDSKHTYKLFVNGSYIGSAEAEWEGKRTGIMNLGMTSRGSSSLFAGQDAQYKFIAVSNVCQKDSDIIANMNWLMNKYNISNE